MTHSSRFRITLGAALCGFLVSGCASAPPPAVDHAAMDHGMMHGEEGMMSDDVAEGFVPSGSAPAAAPTRIVELNDGERMTLTASPVSKTIGGKSRTLWGYHGMIPGPTLKVTQGSTVTINAENRITFPTTVHWHGLRLDNGSDGVPGITQPAITPGGNFLYTLRFPDEGIYWYHPHVREDMQQDLGLYGNIIVTPASAGAYAPVNREEILMLDDLLLDDNGDPVPYGLKDENFSLMGRFGNVMMVNGSSDPYALTAERGSVVRYFLTNAASTRTFRIRFDGAKMKIVGSDIGRYEEEFMADTVTLAPGERAIADVWYEMPGTYDIVHDSPLAKHMLGTVTVTEAAADPSYADAFTTLRANADVAADIERFRGEFGRPVDRTFRLTMDMQGMGGMGMGMMHGNDDGIEWEDTMPMMNKAAGHDDVTWKIVDVETEAENMDILWEVKKDDVKKVRIINDKTSMHPMQHPVHLHGQRFLVLNIDGKQNDRLVWKDTVLIPAGATADLLVEFSNPGDWMLHCHIAEHLSNGMMGMVRVTE